LRLADRAAAIELFPALRNLNAQNLPAPLSGSTGDVSLIKSGAFNREVPSPDKIITETEQDLTETEPGLMPGHTEAIEPERADLEPDENLNSGVK
jgi:hypothetical protein